MDISKMQLRLRFMRARGAYDSSTPTSTSYILLSPFPTSPLPPPLPNPPYLPPYRVIDHLGEQLLKSGYHYYGSEPLYSGLSGEIMHCDIFMGLVYYQRLRHMVADKSQVRATGPVVATTRQPVKGRKKHGGIRLGEMERDALLSHGAAFCLHDRLMNCSDTHIAYCCSQCGGMLSVHALGPLSRSRMTGKATNLSIISKGGIGSGITVTQYCDTCSSSEFTRPIHLPYVYRYLINELAGMGIKLSLGLTD